MLLVVLHDALLCFCFVFLALLFCVAFCVAFALPFAPVLREPPRNASWPVRVSVCRGRLFLALVDMTRGRAS